MCTVSFIPLGDKKVITSNRDEHVNRPAALPPQSYTVNGKHIVYPKDPLRGGTWFAIQGDKTIVVLLNGADVWHKSQPPYRLSRGQIVLTMVTAENPVNEWDVIDLDNIEPFTIVLFHQGSLFQLRWNGDEKSSVPLDVNEPHFWSSATLYPEDVRMQRQQWFDAFVSKPIADEKQVLDFHAYTHADDKENGLIISRDTGLMTQSICQAVLDGNKTEIEYRDLLKKETNSYHVLAI